MSEVNVYDSGVADKCSDMVEIVEVGKMVLSAGGGTLSFGLLASLAIPKLKKKIWGMNGDAEKIKEEIAILRENHLHEVKEMLMESNRQHEIQTALLQEALYILRDIKNARK